MRDQRLIMMTERDWDKQFRQLFRTLGYDLSYHTYNSHRSARGYPDWHLTHPNGRSVFVELKSENGRLRPEQEQWLERLRVCGHEAYVWRPSDFEEAANILLKPPGTREETVEVSDDKSSK